MGKLKCKQRADGRFQKRVPVGKRDGKTVYRTVYAKTIKELNVKAAELEKKSQNNIDGDVTVAEWADKWFSAYKSGKAYNTAKQYRRMLDAYILPKIGGLSLADVRSMDLQDIINSVASRGTNATAKTVLMTARQMFQKAVINRLIAFNPADGVEAPAVVKKRKRALNADERRTVRAASLTDKQLAFVSVLYYAGLRRGETLALELGDVDLDAKVLTVNKTVVFVRNRAEVKRSAKTASGNRVIEIPTALAALLADYALTLANPTNGGGRVILFPGMDGNYMSESAFRSFWRKIAAALGLPADCTPHTFRHNYVTELLRAGVDVKSAQRLAGHSDVAVTMGIYAHGDDGNVARLINDGFND